jgi:LPS export ABC transporter protein LptC
VHSLKSVHLVEAFRDNKEWELFADSARNKASNASWFLKNVRVNFLEQDGNITRVTGDEAIFHTKERKLHIFGNVFVETQNGYIIRTQEIFYTSHDRQLFTLNEVDITRKHKAERGQLKKSTIKGGFMRTFMKDHVLLLGGQVKAFQDQGSGKSLSIKSGQARLSRKQGSVEFYEDVSIQWGGHQFSGEKAEFIYHEGINQLETVILRDRVKIVSEERLVSCDKAVLNIVAGTTELTGNPKVIEVDNQVQGDIIILNHEDNTVSVRKIKANFSERK